MNKLYNYFNRSFGCRIILLLLCLLPMMTGLFAQNITFDNVPPYGTGSTAVTNGGYVFNFTTNKPITLQNSDGLAQILLLNLRRNHSLDHIQS